MPILIRDNKGTLSATSVSYRPHLSLTCISSIFCRRCCFCSSGRSAMPSIGAFMSVCLLLQIPELSGPNPDNQVRPASKLMSKHWAFLAMSYHVEPSLKPVLCLYSVIYQINYIFISPGRFGCPASGDFLEDFRIRKQNRPNFVQDRPDTTSVTIRGRTRIFVTHHYSFKFL